MTIDHDDFLSRMSLMEHQIINAMITYSNVQAIINNELTDNLDNEHAHEIACLREVLKRSLISDVYVLYERRKDTYSLVNWIKGGEWVVSEECREIYDQHIPIYEKVRVWRNNFIDHISANDGMNDLADQYSIDISELGKLIGIAIFCWKDVVLKTTGRAIATGLDDHRVAAMETLLKSYKYSSTKASIFKIKSWKYYFS